MKRTVVALESTSMPTGFSILTYMDGDVRLDRFSPELVYDSERLLDLGGELMNRHSFQPAASSKLFSYAWIDFTIDVNARSVQVRLEITYRKNGKLTSRFSEPPHPEHMAAQPTLEARQAAQR